MRRELEMITLAMVLSFPVAAWTSTSTALADMNPQGMTSENKQGAIVPETPEQQQEKQRQLQRQNLEEQQRLGLKPGQAQDQPDMPKAGMTSPAPDSPSPNIGGKEAGFPNPEFPTVQGEILKIQGELYTVRDIKGNEIRLHVNKDTKMEKDFHVGDQVEIQRTVSGHAQSIKTASAQQDEKRPLKSGGPGKHDPGEAYGPTGGGGAAGTGGSDVFGESGAGQGSGGGAGTQSR